MSHNTLTIRCHNPQQGYQQLVVTAWPWLKSMLFAGHRMIVTFKAETRSTAQNNLMWAMLTEISKQVNWYGEWLTPTDWKHILSASLKKQKAVPGIDGGFVVLGLSTSKMTVAEMAELITLMEAFGADKGVKFSDEATERDMRLAA